MAHEKLDQMNGFAQKRLPYGLVLAKAYSMLSAVGTHSEVTSPAYPMRDVLVSNAGAPFEGMRSLSVGYLLTENRGGFIPLIAGDRGSAVQLVRQAQSPEDLVTSPEVLAYVHAPDRSEPGRTPLKAYEGSGFSAADPGIAEIYKQLLVTTLDASRRFKTDELPMIGYTDKAMVEDDIKFRLHFLDVERRLRTWH